MGIEIERKFVVKDDGWQQERVIAIKNIKQGYLFNDNGKTLRIRLSNDKAFLTYKTPRVGISCGEFEYEIPYEDGQQLYDQCATYLILLKNTLLSSDRF